MEDEDMKPACTAKLDVMLFAFGPGLELYALFGCLEMEKKIQ